MRRLNRWRRANRACAVLVLFLCLVPSAAMANSCDDLAPSMGGQSLGSNCQTASCLSSVLLNTSLEPELRTGAISWLCKFHTAEVVEAIVRAARDEVPEVRFAALADLARRRAAEAEELLGEALSDPDRGLQAVAISGLAGIATDTAIAAIAEAYPGLEPGLRLRALEAVAASGSRDLEGFLASAVLDESDDLRLTAITIETERGSSAYIGELVEVLGKEGLSERQKQRTVAALEKHSGESFGYVKPYNAPMSAKEKGAALARVATWAKGAGFEPVVDKGEDR